MRSTIARVLMLTAVMGLGTAAFAAGMSVTGTIKAIDAKAMTVTLQDGTVYVLPAGFKIADFKIGEKVSLTWEQKGTARDVDTMLPA